MQRKALWTHGQDTQIRRRRGEGASWETIAAELVLNLPAVIERGRRIGAVQSPAELVAPEDPAREPLPAGHPTSWDAINNRTVLAGQPYPLRIFRR